MFLHQSVGLFPTLVFLHGAIAILDRQFTESPGSTFGLSVGLRVLAVRDLHHDLGCELARIGKTDRIRTSNVKPVWSAISRVDALPSLVTAWLNLNSKTVLFGVPAEVRSFCPGLEVFDDDS
jgi:hypothetical protein